MDERVQRFSSPYLRVWAGSAILLILVVLFGTDYLGAGMDIVDKAIYEQVQPYDFVLKALFTAITIGCGFKGGEIVPTFFIGATSGYASLYQAQKFVYSKTSPEFINRDAK